MIDPAGNLNVRQHVRRQCRIDARARLDGPGASQVALARSITDAGRWFSVRVVDISEGGLGLESPVFLPRACTLLVRTTPTSQDDNCQVPFECRIQRVTMIDRTPLYYLGLSFVGDLRAQAQAACRVSAPAGGEP